MFRRQKGMSSPKMSLPNVVLIIFDDVGVIFASTEFVVESRRRFWPRLKPELFLSIGEISSEVDGRIGTREDFGVITHGVDMISSPKTRDTVGSSETLEISRSKLSPRGEHSFGALKEAAVDVLNLRVDSINGNLTRWPCWNV